jgi:hypothetical protein
MSGHLSTAREALMAELLRDVDLLLARLETVQAELGPKIEQASNAAAGNVFLAARLHFESVISDNERKLVEAGRFAAAQIGNQLNSGVAQLVAATDALERKAFRLLCLLVVLALVTGAIGGFVGAKLAG